MTCLTRLIIAAVILLPISPACAQGVKQVLFKDASHPSVLEDVVLWTPSGEEIGRSGKSGYAGIKTDTRGEQMIIAIKDGYRPDTLYVNQLPDIVFMRPLSVVLKEAVISSSKVQRVFKDVRQYVTDYDFAGADNLVVATHGYKSPRLLLLTQDGTPLSEMNLYARATALFCNCTGQRYIHIEHKLYPVSTDDNVMTPGTPYEDLALYAMRQCQLDLQGNRFYRMIDYEKFHVIYSVLPAGDSILHPFFDLMNPNAAYNSWREGKIMYSLQAMANDAATKQTPVTTTPGAGMPPTTLSTGSVGLANLSYALTMFNDASRTSYQRQMFDNINLHKLVAPIFTTDSLAVIFDLYSGMIRFFDRNGIPQQAIPLLAATGNNAQVNILKDGTTNRFYMHRYGNLNQQTVQELDIHTGNVTGAPVMLEKPLAENVKIRNGLIYYLWQQGGGSGATQQLFVQKAF